MKIYDLIYNLNNFKKEKTNRKSTFIGYCSSGTVSLVSCRYSP